MFEIGEMKDTSRYAIVTGAASGMGREYSRILAGMGYRIAAVDISAEGLQKLSGELGADRVTAIVQDLASADGARELIEKTERLGIRAEILVNNAGIFSYCHVCSHPEGYIEKITALHDITPAVLCRHFAEQMASDGGGWILNVSSLSAWMPYPGIALYSATKAYTRAFSRALDSEMRRHGVSVTAAFFGAVATPLIGLNERLTRIALRLGIMITPSRAAEAALKAMFRRRRSVTPGLVNKIGKPFLAVCPERLRLFADRKLEPLRKK